jgi:hypothetical protein
MATIGLERRQKKINFVYALLASDLFICFLRELIVIFRESNPGPIICISKRKDKTKYKFFAYTIIIK